MRRAYYSIVVASLLIISFAGGSEAMAGNGSREDSATTRPDPRITAGIEIGWLSILHDISSFGGPWVGVGIGQGFRVRLRILLDSWGCCDYYIPADAVVDRERTALLALDFECTRLKSGPIRWPVGLTVGFERAMHEFRQVPYEPIVFQSDSYPILEPWVGIRAARSAKLTGLKAPLRVLSLAIAYRFPMNPDLPGYHRSDFAGRVVYLRLGPG